MSMDEEEVQDEFPQGDEEGEEMDICPEYDEILSPEDETIDFPELSEISIRSTRALSDRFLRTLVWNPPLYFALSLVNSSNNLVNFPPSRFGSSEDEESDLEFGLGEEGQQGKDKEGSKRGNEEKGTGKGKEEKGATKGTPEKDQGGAKKAEGEGAGAGAGAGASVAVGAGEGAGAGAVGAQGGVPGEEGVAPPRSKHSYECRATWHVLIHVVEGTFTYNYIPHLKVQATALSCPPGLSLKSFMQLETTYVDRTCALSSSFSTRNNEVVCSATSNIPLPPLSFFDNKVLQAGTQFSYNLGKKIFSFNSAMQFILPIFYVPWKIAGKIDLNNSWSIAASHNMGLPGVFTTYRWRKKENSNLRTFATGISVDLNPFVLKFKIDQAKGWGALLKVPFLANSGLSIGVYMNTVGAKEEKGFKYAVAWDFFGI